MSGQISVVKSILYVIVQLIGASTAAWVLRLLIPDNYFQPANERNFSAPVTTFGVNKPGRFVYQSASGSEVHVLGDITEIQAIVVEVILTTAMMLVTFASCDTKFKKDQYGLGPFAVGIIVTACILCAVCSSFH